MNRYIIEYCNYFIFVCLLISAPYIYTNQALDTNTIPLLHDLETQLSFHEKYQIVKEIGKGTSGKVFLCKSRHGEIYAAKQYIVNFKEHLEQHGISVKDFIKNLAGKELEIGQLTDHPNIVKIHEVIFEDDTAFVIMDYIEGKPLDRYGSYTHEMRLLFMRQFLSAVEHLLLRNIIPDDLWRENILISKERLVLIDLSGYDYINDTSYKSLNHYISEIEDALYVIGQEVAQNATSNCTHLISVDLRDESISSSHVGKLVHWIEALQKELSTPIRMDNTIHADTSDEILTTYNQLQKQYPNHVSFCTAQHSQFSAYSLIAAHVLKKFSPGKLPESYIQNTHLLRYPIKGLPKTLQELFQKYPVREDYDTAYSMVGNALISASPSLNETEQDESAWAIFNDNDRKSDIGDYINAFFEAEQISPSHYRNRIKSLVKSAPKSSCGLLYNFFIPKDAPLHKALYLSEAYGIPVGDPLSNNKILDFFIQYSLGLAAQDNHQVRFLPSALISENDFDLDQIKSYRFTTISKKEFEDYAKNVECTVSEIYEDHLEEVLQLSRLAAKVNMLADPIKKQESHLELCKRHLSRCDHQLALYFWSKLDGTEKMSQLTDIIICLLKNNQFSTAHSYFQKYEDLIGEHEQLIAFFAIIYLEQCNFPMLELMLTKLSDPSLKQMLLTLIESR